MEKISAGRTAEVFTYGHEKILKLYFEGVSLDSIQYEFDITKLVNSLTHITPIAYECVKLENRNGIVFEKIEGHSLFQALLQPDNKVEELGKLFADLHLHIHKQVIDDEMRHQSRIQLQKEVLMKDINATNYLDFNEKNQLLYIIEQLPEGNKLCHGDYHPDNIMIGNTNWLIDWMTGMVGNPLGDVARTLILIRYGIIPTVLPTDIQSAIDEMRTYLAQVYLERYLSHTEHKLEEINDWMLPVAAARLVESIPIDEKNNLLSFIRNQLVMK